MRQKDRILADLQRYTFVCGNHWLEEHMPRYAARIYDLRQDGHIIVRQRCQNFLHRHRTIQYQYELVDDPPTLLDESWELHPLLPADPWAIR